MRSAHRVETVRTAERTLMARLPDGALMQRAAAGLAAACADVLPRRVYGSRIVLLTGSGDNGGDTLYAGCPPGHTRRGRDGRPPHPRPHPPGRPQDPPASRRHHDHPHSAAAPISRADLVLDGIVGIGGKGGLRPEAAHLADLVAASRATVVAVDLPSGIEPDTGEVHGAAVRADLTVTFGTHKPGLLIDPARAYAGSVRLIDIGLADTLPAAPALESLQHADLAALLPHPSQESDKYRRGVVGIAAGSARYPGAAVLAVAGALRGGAGAVRYVGAATDAVLARFPETLVSNTGPKKAGRVQAWVAGPGAG